MKFAPLLLSLTVIFSLFSCSSTTKNNPQNINKNKEIQNCKNKNALSCSKLGYYFNKREDYLKAERYYRYACNLKNSAACSNLKNFNDKHSYFKKANGVMHYHSSNILNCYQSLYPAVKTSDIGKSQYAKKEKYNMVTLYITINQLGKADSVLVKTRLPNAFKRCAKEVVNNIQFPRPRKNLLPKYTYNLTIKSRE